LVTLCARHGVLWRACRQITKQFVEPPIGVNRWRVLLHQATSVRGWAVIAVQVASQHAKHGHLLATVMRGVRDAAVITQATERFTLKKVVSLSHQDSSRDCITARRFALSPHTGG